MHALSDTYSTDLRDALLLCPVIGHPSEVTTGEWSGFITDKHSGSYSEIFL
jgi:hypothetical protein